MYRELEFRSGRLVPMTPEERNFLRDFFRQVSDQPIQPMDPRYIPLYEYPEMADDDPVELMARAIEWTPGGSVQLLSGYRGTGKSTELMRLAERLRENDFLVFRCDIEDYLNMSVPVDVSDFLMAISGAFGDAVSEANSGRDHPTHEGYWERLVNFLTRTELGDVSASLGLPLSLGSDVVSANIKANLKSDPSFKQRLQKHMAGHLGALVNDVHDYFESCISDLKKSIGNEREVVLLVDSIEHFRGTYINAQIVQSSIEDLFVSHSERLHLPHLHVVYTVPPYLKIRYGNLGALYEPGGVRMLPALKLRDRDGEWSREGYDAMERVVAARGDWQRLLGQRSVLDRLIKYSGGHLRDLLRLLAEVLRRAKELPVPGSTVDAAVNQLRSEFLPIADDDARWLAGIARSHETALPSTSKLPDLARFFDTHLALCYRNGDEWYDVHPLIAEQVIEQADEDPGAG